MRHGFLFARSRREVGVGPLASALLAAVFLLCAFAMEGLALGREELAAFPRDDVEIEAAGARHRFRVELALTPAHRERGLMFRTEIPDNTGMLFVNEGERPVSMWMKNTLVSLDMLFLAADGRIVKIHPEAEPLSLRVITSDEPVKGVLELRGGTARKLGLVPGDRVSHPAFRSSSPRTPKIP